MLIDNIFINRCCDPSVCLSRFLILSRSLDGDTRTSPFHAHSIEGSTVGYTRVQMLSALEREDPCSNISVSQLDSRGRRIVTVDFCVLQMILLTCLLTYDRAT